MIFCSVNEDGTPKWKQVLEGTATVTRRLKPMKVGKVFAVQPNRGKKAVCYARVVSCMSHLDWSNSISYLDYKDLKKEAEREGFKDWWNILKFFYSKGIDIMDTYRIEFGVVK